MNAFQYNYESALRRIGLVPSKAEGRDPHGHRHAYGRRLTRAGLHPVVIKKCLHHASLESQTPYTAPSFSEVSNALATATAKLNCEKQMNGSGRATDWQALIEHGFEDIDPSGLFSGKYPKLRG